MLLFKWTFLSKLFAYYYLLVMILQKEISILRGEGVEGGNFSSLRNARVKFFYHFIICFKYN